jgi:Rieske Fe-S protein
VKILDWWVDLKWMKGKPMTKQISLEKKDSGCSRRVFMKHTMTGLGTIALGSFALSVIEGYPHSASAIDTAIAASSRRDDPSITVDVSEPENRPLATVGGTLALGKNDVDKKGLLLYRESEIIVKAYSRECAHLKCTVGPFIDGVSTCPCHGSQYDLSGDRIAGPARRGLRQYKAYVAGNIVTIRS